MKTTPALLLAAALLVAGCQSTNTTPAPATVGNVTVAFTDSDKFTDCREDFGGFTSQDYLDQLTAHLQTVAAPKLTDGQKLSVTFTDIDLAGDFQPTRPGLNNVRIVREIYLPRMSLNFQLTGADGKVVKEGERNLTDINFMMNINIIGRDLPLFYDKPLLTNWVNKEFE